MVSAFVNHNCSDIVRFRDFPGPGGHQPAAPDRADGRRAASLPAPCRAPAGRLPPRANGPIRRRSAKRKAAAQAPSRAACAGLGRVAPPRCRRRAAPGDAALAIAAPAERGGAGGGEGAVVDIAQSRHPLDQRRRRAARRPPPSRARAACGSDRRAAWPGSWHSVRHRRARPVRAPRASSGGRAVLLRSVFTAMIVPQSGRIMNAPRLLERRLSLRFGDRTAP